MAELLIFMLLFGPLAKALDYWYLSIPVVVICLLLNKQIPGLLFYVVAGYYIIMYFMISPWIGLIGLICVGLFIRWSIQQNAGGYGGAGKVDNITCPYCGSSDTYGNHCNSCGQDF